MKYILDSFPVFFYLRAHNISQNGPIILKTEIGSIKHAYRNRVHNFV